MIAGRRRWSAATAALVSTLLVAGCSTPRVPDERAPSPEVTAEEAVEPTATPVEPIDPAELVGSVEIGPSDLPAAYGPDVMQAGDEVAGQVTLDVCGGSFPSEGLRTARHQVFYPLGDPDSPGYQRAGDAASVASETVAYSPGGAEQALAEVRNAIATCPRGFVPSVVGSMSMLKTTFDTVRPAPDWQDDHVAFVASVHLETGESFRMAVVYQRREDVMAATYVMTAGRDRGIELARHFASVLSERLEALPDADVAAIPNA